MKGEYMRRNVAEATEEERSKQAFSQATGVAEVAPASLPMNTPDHLKPASGKAFRPAACHPHSPVYGAGPLCRKCADLVRWQGERGKSKVRAYVAENTSLNAAMRADVEDKIGKLKPYERKPEKERKHVNTRKKSVAKHAATTVIVNSLDYDKAAAELKPDMSPYEQHRLAHQLESDSDVQAQVQSLLKKRGLDDESRDYFVQRLWQMFESADPRQEQKALAAMRILGRAFVSEKIENVEVTSLKINGINEGLERMLSQSEDAQSTHSPFDSVRSQSSMKDEAFDE
jgi:hypothetical protein